MRVNAERRGFCNEPLSILISPSKQALRRARSEIRPPLSEQRDGASERAVEKSEEERVARKGRVELVCNLQEEGQSDPLSLSLSLTADLAHATFSSFRSDDYDGRINRSS